MYLAECNFTHKYGLYHKNINHIPLNLHPLQTLPSSHPKKKKSRETASLLAFPHRPTACGYLAGKELILSGSTVGVMVNDMPVIIAVPYISFSSRMYISGPLLLKVKKV